MNRRLPLIFVSACLLVSGTLIQAQQPGWTLTGSLGTARSYGHTATLLANGKVLVVGGSETLSPYANPYWRGIGSAELYDPATGQWSATGSLISPRSDHFAVRLNNGKVLVAGGNNGYRIPVNTAEVYDPDTGVWSDAGNFNGGLFARATLLADGRVLVTGGSTGAQLYDPASGTWNQTGTRNAPRSFGYTARLLQGGKVLVIGGGDPASGSTELYDPATERWTATGNLVTGHLWDHQAVVLPIGKVLVFGGGISGDDSCNGVHDAELYDPATGQWSTTGSAISTRNDYSNGNYTTLLPNGKVLVVGGGRAGTCDALNSAELYDPATGGWSVTASLNVARSGHTVTMLANGKVLVVGGDGGTTAELFDSGTPTVTSVSAATLAVGGALAPASIATVLGTNLATGILESPGAAATQLAGVSVKVRDRTGGERLAPLFFVSPGQINYQVPLGTIAGLATVTVTSGDNFVAAGLVEIAGVGPGLFAANSSGQGVAAGLWIRVAPGEAQTQNYLFDLTTRKSVPLDLGPSSDQVFLSLYGTGFRWGAGATATVGGVRVLVSAFAPVAGYPGLDVVNIGPLPRLLTGRGEVDVAFSMDGKAANPVKVNIR